MAHAELFMDVHGRYRWLAFHDGEPVEASARSYPTAEEAYADALKLALTIVGQVREGDTVRHVSVDDAFLIQRKPDDVHNAPREGASLQRAHEQQQSERTRSVQTFTVYSVMDGHQRDPLGTVRFDESGRYVGGTWQGVLDRFGPFAVGDGLSLDNVADACPAYVFKPGRRVARRE
jgi:hypothetical protein